MPPATAGWQQWTDKPQPQIAINITISRLFFSLSPYLWWDKNQTTCMLKSLLKLYCIWTWDTLWVFFFVLCCFVLSYFSPLMRQLQNNIWGTISRTGGWGTNTKIIKTESLLHLNYIYIYSFIYFLFSIFNPLSVSLMPFQLMVH
jgi:hypothetical protein